MARKKIEIDSTEALQKQELGGRILQIRRTFFEDNNRRFAEKIGENEKTLSQICSGDRNGGWAIVQKILDNMPNINANWLLKGRGEMQIVVGDSISNNATGNNNVGTIVQGKNITNAPTPETAKLIESISDLTNSVSALTASNLRQSEQISTLLEQLRKK